MLLCCERSLDVAKSKKEKVYELYRLDQHIFKKVPFTNFIPKI